MAKLNDFIAQVKSSGLMRTARYSVIIPDTVKGQLLNLYCDQVQLPGINYSTSANMSYGETREIPYGRMFDPVTMSFYVDNNMDIKRFFDSWLYSIQNPTDRTFNYYNDYVKTIQIIVEDLENKEKYSVELVECYPKTVNSISLDYASKDIMKLSVTMTYKHWKILPINGVTDSEYISNSIFGSTPNFGIFNNLATNAIGIVENYGATLLQNKLIGL